MVDPELDNELGVQCIIYMQIQNVLWLSIIYFVHR